MRKRKRCSQAHIVASSIPCPFTVFRVRHLVAWLFRDAPLHETTFPVHQDCGDKLPASFPNFLVSTLIHRTTKTCSLGKSMLLELVLHSYVIFSDVKHYKILLQEA